VTSYSEDVKGVGSADTAICLLRMFDLESVFNQTFSKTSSTYFGGSDGTLAANPSYLVASVAISLTMASAFSTQFTQL
jgi:hypothetical protein